MKGQTMNPAFLTIPEGAQYLRIGKSKLNELLAENAIKRVKLGRRTLLPVDDLQRFAETLKAAA
jgi:excisionase family DNA binding protein